MQAIVFQWNLALYKKYSKCHSAFLKAVRKMRTAVAHNFIHRNCAQLFWTTGHGGRFKRVV
jgi:hypothetical protein